MIDFPFCKINLGLQVLRKRADGFHDIETCFYPVPWNDILEIVPANSNKFDITGLSIPGDLSNNIVLKAYNLLKKDFELEPCHIHLHKILPLGAGLGGGSSDGAHTLKLLGHIFELRLPGEKLKSYSARLGSDCPFFLDYSPQLAVGRGEILNPISINLSGLTLVIVKPPVSVSTTEAYSGIHPEDSGKSLASVLEEPLVIWKQILKNDFEKSIFAKYPIISEIKNKLYELGAIYASMSGSGSSVFGLFENYIEMEKHFDGSILWQKKL